MYFDVAVVHDKIFGQEILECYTIDYVKLAISFQPIHHVIDASLKLIPVLLVDLDLRLGNTQILIKLLKIVVVIDLVELILLRDL